MAQPMHCDYAGCGLLAEWITSRIDNGDTLAWCDEHYLFLCRSVVAQADQTLDQAPEDQPQPGEPGGAAAGAEQPTEPGDTGPAMAAGEPPQVIEGYAPPNDSGQGAWSEDVTPEPTPADDAPVASQDGPGAPQAPEPVSAATRVVKRGTSPSRKAYQARVRRQAAANAPQEDQTDGDNQASQEQRPQATEPSEAEAEPQGASPPGGR